MDIETLVTMVAATIGVISAVVSWLFSRKTQTGELEADVEELALLVERMGKAQRRERMARVRQGSGASPDAPAPSQEPGQPPLDFPADPKAHKAELRRRLLRSKMQ